MATYEQRIAALEVKVTEFAQIIQEQTSVIQDLQEKLEKESGYAYAIVYDAPTAAYKIYLPYGALTVNSRISSVEDTIGWFSLTGSGPVYVNIYRQDLDYYGKISDRMDEDAIFYFCVGNIISPTRIERFVNGGVVLSLNEEVRGAFDIVNFNGERFMYLPRNGTINYGGFNYTVKSAEAIGGWQKVQAGVTYWCWARSGEPYAYVTEQNEVPEEDFLFSFRVGVVE